MGSDLNEKMFSIEKEIGDKIDSETKNLSDSLTDDFSEKIGCLFKETLEFVEVGGQAVLGRQQWAPTPWLTGRNG